VGITSVQSAACPYVDGHDTEVHLIYGGGVECRFHRVAVYSMEPASDSGACCLRGEDGE
jgi:hypothetical protein